MSQQSGQLFRILAPQSPTLPSEALCTWMASAGFSHLELSDAHAPEWANMLHAAGMGYIARIPLLPFLHVDALLRRLSQLSLSPRDGVLLTGLDAFLAPHARISSGQPAWAVSIRSDGLHTLMCLIRHIRAYCPAGPILAQDTLCPWCTWPVSVGGWGFDAIVQTSWQTSWVHYWTLPRDCRRYHYAQAVARIATCLTEQHPLLDIDTALLSAIRPESAQALLMLWATLPGHLRMTCARLDPFDLPISLQDWLIQLLARVQTDMSLQSLDAESYLPLSTRDLDSGVFCYLRRNVSGASDDLIVIHGGTEFFPAYSIGSPLRAQFHPALCSADPRLYSPMVTTVESSYLEWPHKLDLTVPPGGALYASDSHDGLIESPAHRASPTIGSIIP